MAVDESPITAKYSFEENYILKLFEPRISGLGIVFCSGVWSGGTYIALEARGPLTSTRNGIFNRRAGKVGKFSETSFLKDTQREKLLFA